MSVNNKAITNFEHALAMFEKHYKDYTFWAIYEGKEPNRGTRISTSEALGTNDDVDKHIEHIRFVMSNYEPGYFCLVTRKKPNDTASEQLYRFKYGNPDEFSGGEGVFGLNMKGTSNPMQAFMMQAMIKGLGGGSDVAELKKEIEVLRLEQKHEKELEKERSAVSNRIMGLVEDNFETILDKLPTLGMLLGGAKASNRPAAAPVQGATPTVAKTETVDTKGKMLHQLPLTYNPQSISTDAMVHYANQFKNINPNINPSVLWAKIVAFAAQNPDQAEFLFTQLEAQTAEPASDE